MGSEMNVRTANIHVRPNKSDIPVNDAIILSASEVVSDLFLLLIVLVVC